MSSGMTLVQRLERTFGNRWVQLQGTHHQQEVLTALTEARDYCVELGTCPINCLFSCIEQAAELISPFNQCATCYKKTVFNKIMIRAVVLHLIQDIGPEHEEKLRRIAMDEFCCEIFWALREIPSLYEMKKDY